MTYEEYLDTGGFPSNRWYRNAKGKFAEFDLKPCPFCGGSPETSFGFTRFDAGMDGVTVTECIKIWCPNGHCQMDDSRIFIYTDWAGEDIFLDYEPNMELASKWNNRTDDSKKSKKYKRSL